MKDALIFLTKVQNAMRRGEWRLAIQRVKDAIHVIEADSGGPVVVLYANGMYRLCVNTWGPNRAEAMVYPSREYAEGWLAGCGGGPGGKVTFEPA